MGIFLNDLRDGEAVEAEVLPLMRRYLPAGYFYEHDPQQKTHDLKFVSAERTILVEVKWDRKSQDTGNIAIEYQCSGKWSGIAATKADFWVVKYWDRGQWHIRAIKTSELVKEWRSRRYPSVYGGDECRARLILIPVRAFSAMSVPLQTTFMR